MPGLLSLYSVLRRLDLRLPSAGFIVFIFLFAVSPVPAQHHKSLPQEELEDYDQPPALFSRTGVSPGMVSTFDTFTSQQVNVNAQGQNITGDAANEPSITVDPTDRSNIVIAWRQFNSV